MCVRREEKRWCSMRRARCRTADSPSDMIAVAALSIATLRPPAFSFRHAPPVCVAGTYDSEDWWSGDSAAKKEEEDDDDAK